MKAIVESDGTTVWANGPDGSCLGRFGTMGIDIHNSAADQADGKGECLLCTHGRTTLEHWNRFVDGMMHHHGVKISQRHRPNRLSPQD